MRPPERLRELEDAALPRRGELAALTPVEPVGAEARLKRDDGALDLHLVEHREPALQRVAGDVDGPGSLVAEIEVRVVQAGRPGPCRERREELLRQEVLMDVGGRYLPIMRAYRLRSESAELNVAIAYPEMVLPSWR